MATGGLRRLASHEHVCADARTTQTTSGVRDRSYHECGDPLPTPFGAGDELVGIQLNRSISRLYIFTGRSLRIPRDIRLCAASAQSTCER
jgi:hypothetical protein